MNYYEVLGINQNATKQDIQQAFRGKALQFHPEKESDVDSLFEFARVCEAYEVLSNNEFKAVYDIYGEEVLKQGISDEQEGTIGGCFQFDNKIDPVRVFKEFFATDNPYEAIHCDSEQRLLNEFENLASYKPRQKSATKCVEFWCELEDVYNGCEKSVTFTRAIIDEKKDTSVEERTIKIRIAPGEVDGTSFYFDKEGDRATDALPGAVEFVLRIKPHRKFRREGLDLLCIVEIPLHQAFSNQPIEVETIDQKRLSVLLPYVITPGHKHVIKGEGMKKANNNKGDLIIKVHLTFPKHLTELQQSILKTALLFPKYPSQEQKQIAEEFQTKGRSYCNGWMKTTAVRNDLLT